MNKKFHFFIDDVIWSLRDLTRIKPQSMFDIPFFKVLKNAHDRYGMKVQLNLFYRTSAYYGNDDFCLADVTDDYKNEWENCSDWLKLAFHAKEEFPEYPFINAKYKDTVEQCGAVENEVIRFAGKNTYTYCTCPHWNTVSRDGVKAMYECGIRMISSTAGETFDFDEYKHRAVPGHDSRLLYNRQPEARLASDNPEQTGDYLALCSYNHLTLEENNKYAYNTNCYIDKETGMAYKPFVHHCINALSYDEIAPWFENYLGDEYICLADHEQYFYEDYFNYQSDYAEKIYKMCECAIENGYEFIFYEDMLP